MLFNIAGENYQVPTLWEIVRDLRKRVSDKLKDLPREVRDGAVLTVTELAENLVKYAVQDPDDPPTLSLTIEDGIITIVSRNIVDSEVHARNVLKVIDELANHEDPMLLYANAIAETLDRRTAGTQQGFYRIAAIAQFSLKSDLKESRLMIEATRKTT